MNLLQRPIVHLVQLGRLRYGTALKVQEAMVNRLQEGEDKNFLILVEHEPGTVNPQW